jgi:hypothetical protein
LHVKDYTKTLRAPVDDMVQGIPNGATPEDARKKAAAGERALHLAVNEWRQARIPGHEGTDITHGGPGQPVSGMGNNPEGEPGPYVPP